MIKITYKPGKYIYPYNTKYNYNNNYCQQYIDDKLVYKGYYKNDKYMGYGESYLDFMNKGLKYKI
jgi:hypothetical protein